MVGMAKVLVLLLVVFAATALGNSRETEKQFPHSSLPPSPVSYSPLPSPLLAPYAAQQLDSVTTPAVGSPPPPEDHSRGIARALCIGQCGTSCFRKKGYARDICWALCIAKCAIIPTDSLVDVSCTVDCAQSSINSLRYDASVIEDRVTSCYKRCKRD